MQIDPVTDILGLIDVQPTFMPGGELPVADGDAIIPVINQLLRRFDHAFATQDWHPANHASFASAHPGKQPYDTIEMPYGKQMLWPEHGIAGMPTAAIHPAIDQARIEAIIRKGFRPALDSYSAFFENDRRTPTGLEAWLRQRGFSRLFLCGLATDFCVAWSAEDAARLDFDVTIFEDACRGIGLPEPGGRTTIDTARDRLTAMGVRFVQVARCYPTDMAQQSLLLTPRVAATALPRGRAHPAMTVSARLLILAAFMLASVPVRAADSPAGLWLTRDHDGIIKIYPCDGDLCAEIAGVILDHPADPTPVDYRGVSQCHLQLITDAKPIEPNLWKGHIVNPRNGTVYGVEFHLDPHHNLALRGFIGLPLFGETQTWTRYNGRVPADCRLLPATQAGAKSRTLPSASGRAQ